MWTRQDGVPINNNSQLKLLVYPLRTSDSSKYTCTATVDIPNVVSVSGADSTDLVVASKCECEYSMCNYVCIHFVRCNASG